MTCWSQLNSRSRSIWRFSAKKAGFQKKKERKSKAKRHETELKEIRIRTPKIGQHDLQIKVGHARDFLERGDRVRFTLRFRGREVVHKDLGQEILAAVGEGLSDVARVEENAHMDRRAMTMVLVPLNRGKPAKRAKPRPAAAGEQAAAAAEAEPPAAAPPAT